MGLRVYFVLTGSSSTQIHQFTLWIWAHQCLLRHGWLWVAQTEKGKQQALGAGHAIRAMMERDGNPYNLFFYTSPYKRSRQTFEEIGKAINPGAIIGAQEEVQLREQDFGNFQACR